ncbi:hypothetical protein, partial [Pseudarthrobacter albicanus]|uniref:hypothetical protein n=1 Tax=Pseudarthrobacter albicanus TaxID=2823873 RepID=UPI001BA57DA5
EVLPDVRRKCGVVTTFSHVRGTFQALITGSGHTPDEIPRLVLSESFERADQLIEILSRTGFPLPAIFPTCDGGLSLVWQKALNRTTVYIDPDEELQVEKVPGGPLPLFASNDPKAVASEVSRLSLV